MKDPLVGGVWTWHQDYGYWYRNGVLWPLPVSVSVAIDPATRENGCLQVIPRSHELGRIDHLQSGDQAGADMERVNAVLERLPLVHCEMEPGDAVFFHPNMLHRSDMNRSQHPRWSMICCYNTARTDPYPTRTPTTPATRRSTWCPIRRFARSAAGDSPIPRPTWPGSVRPTTIPQKRPRPKPTAEAQRPPSSLRLVPARLDPSPSRTCERMRRCSAATVFHAPRFTRTGAGNVLLT